MVRKGSGWHGEPKRHSDAIKKGMKTRYQGKTGVRTVKRSTPQRILDNTNYYKTKKYLEIQKKIDKIIINAPPIKIFGFWNIKNKSINKKIPYKKGYFIAKIDLSAEKLLKNSQKRNVVYSFKRHKFDYEDKVHNVWSKDEIVYPIEHRSDNNNTFILWKPIN